MQTRLLIGLLVIAVLSTACQPLRTVLRGRPDTDDYALFPSVPLPASKEIFYFAETEADPLADYTYTRGPAPELPLRDYLRQRTTTTAFLVIRNDTILFEEYFDDRQVDDVSLLFSVSKSVTSLLVGIAFDDGLFESLDDPITKYVPEIKVDDPRWAELTLRQLLNMRSGLDFNENSNSPFSGIAKLYYGKNQVKALNSFGFATDPGSEHEYQSSSTALLGLAVENVTGKKLGAYLNERVWQPMGAEYAGSWSLDRKDGNSKAYCCLATTARDLAKIGRLYLNGGVWEGQRIVSEDWIRRAVTPELDNDAYQFHWYSVSSVAASRGEEYRYPDSLAAVAGAGELHLDYFYVDEVGNEANEWHIHFATDEYYALGIMSQLMFLDPKTNTIVVRLGKKYDHSYVGLARRISKYLNQPEVMR